MKPKISNRNYVLKNPILFNFFIDKSYVLVKYNPIRIPIFPEKRNPMPEYRHFPTF